MNAKTIMLFFVLMLSVFAGSALGGHESDSNTWYGLDAGNSITSGYANTFIGYTAGSNTTTGYDNTFSGYGTGVHNITGFRNTFSGCQAGYWNTTGTGNTFSGSLTGSNNTTGAGNTFSGAHAGLTNTTGYENTFSGFFAGFANTTGDNNTFIGRQAGTSNSIESYNTLIGSVADIDGTSGAVTNATAIGYHSYVSQSNSLVLGSINGVNDASSSVNVGIGTSAPVRQLHIVGDQAVFRMDRPYDTAAFMLVRTDGSGSPLKTFVVGTNASASNTGEFVINDLGTAVSGGGSRRMTIANNGSVNFPGAVTGASFTPVSSIVHKTNVKTYENALETVKKLRGVRFNWKGSGKASVGLIAEEVDKVIPEVVAYNDKDATGVNYDSLVGVLVEAVKEQEARHQAELKEQQKTISALSEKVSELERLLIMSNSVSKAD